MALINCVECNKEISDEAKSCPSCGAKNKSNSIGFAGWLFVLIALIPIIFLIAIFLSPADKKESNVQLIQEEIYRLDRECISGKQSACDEEKALTNIYNMSK